MGRNKVVPASMNLRASAGQELAWGFKSRISAAIEWRRTKSQLTKELFSPLAKVLLWLSCNPGDFAED